MPQKSTFGQTAISYKIDWYEELLRPQALGKTYSPESMPYPDQIKSDFRTGDARVKGSMTMEEKAEFET